MNSSPSLHPPKRSGAGQYRLYRCAAVVITTADSRSGILALLKRTGFHLPVFMLADEPVSAPVGVTAVIGGNAQEWLELENAACRYEAELLPPFMAP